MRTDRMFTGAWRWVVLFATFVVGSVGAAPQFPALTGRVVDDAGLLSASAHAQLTQLTEQHERATTNQVVVVTLKSLQGYPIEDFGYQLGRHWGIGQKDKNNGALLIVAPNEREVRIEVGYGLEGTLTDALASHIIQSEIIPRFKRGDMEGGIVAGTQLLLRVLAGEPVETPPPASTEMEHIGFIPAVLIFLAIVGQFVASMISRKAGGTVFALMAGGVMWLSSGSILIALVSAVLVFLFVVVAGRGGGGMPSGRYSRGYGGGFGGGGFRGGGGSFGGGGASGRW